jgi:hypothetical protein
MIRAPPIWQIAGTFGERGAVVGRMQRNCVGLAGRKRTHHTSDEQPCVSLAEVAQPATVYNFEYPKLGNRESEVTQLDRDIAPLQSAGEKRLRSTLFVEHDNMWPFNLRIDTQDEQEEIELSVSTRTAGVPKVANRLDFGARSENVNVALLNHLIHDIDLMPGPTARLGIRSEQTRQMRGF